MLIVVALTYAVTYESTRWSRVEGMISIREMSQIMAGFYITFAIGTVIGVIGITPAIVAGAISSERERRTIEYLFTTHLTNSEIILDKVLARLLTIGQMILVTLPILAILRFMGGVPGQMLLWHFVILFSTAMMCLALSLVASTWNERTRQAISNAYSFVFLWLIGGGLLFLLATLLDRQANLELLATPIYWLAGAFIYINPFVTLTVYGGLNNGGLGIGFDSWQVGIQCAVQIVVALLLIAICALNIRRVHIKNAGKASKSNTKTIKGKNRVRPFENRPMLWKEMYTNETKKSRWNWLRQVIVVWFALSILVPTIWNLIKLLDDGNGAEEFAGILVGINAGLGSLIVLSIASRAAGAIPLEKERDTWLSLMGTPLSAREILWAKLLGTLYAYRWHFAAIVFVNALGILLSPAFIVTLLILIVTLTVVSSAAAMIGIRTSLGMDSSSKAITSSTAILLALGGGYLMLIGPMLALSRSGEGSLIFMAPCIPFLLGITQFPVMAWINWGNETGLFVFTYLLGIGGYFALTAILMQAATDVFDALHGRQTSEILTHLAEKAEAQSSA